MNDRGWDWKDIMRIDYGRLVYNVYKFGFYFVKIDSLEFLRDWID